MATIKQFSSASNEITNTVSTVAVTENSAISNAIFTAAATNTSSLSFSLTGADADLMTIDRNGVVRLKSAADYESKPSYRFNVITTDATGNSATQSVAVNVVNVDENIQLADGLNAIGTITVIRNAPVNHSIIGDFKNLLDYVIDNPTILPVPIFTSNNIPATSGLTLTSDGLLTGTPLSAGSYNITVNTDDGVNNGVDVSRTYRIVVVDKPSIEGMSISNAAGASVTTGKAGQSINIQVTLSENLENTQAIGAISATFNAGKATLNNVTQGAITTVDGKAVLNFSASLATGDASAITLSSLALGSNTLVGALSQGALSGTLNKLAITSNFLLDNSGPKIGGAGSVSINENIAVGSAIYTAQASDANAFSFSLRGADALLAGSAPNSRLFSIDPTSGVITVNGPIDFEDRNNTDRRYNLTIQAQDALGNVSSKAIAVNVRDVNEATVLRSASTPGSLTFYKGVNANLLASQSVAQDFADPEGRAINYVVSAGTLPAGLVLNSRTGVISGTPLASNSASMVTVTITANDGVNNGTDASRVYNISLISNPLLRVSDSLLSGSDNTVTFTVYGEFAAGSSLQLFKGNSAIGNPISVARNAASQTISVAKSSLLLTDNGAASSFTVRYISPGATSTLTSIAVNVSSDTIAPSVASISLSGNASNGLLNAGDIVTADVTFTEAIGNISGNPSLNLNVGNQVRIATLNGFSGSTARFTYRIVTGDTDADGISINAPATGNQILFNGGSISDLAGNVRAMPSQTGTLSAVAGLKVDTTPASVSAISLSATGSENGRYNAGDVVTANVTFSEMIMTSSNLATPMNITLIVGNQTRLATFAGASASVLSFVYTIAASDNDADGISIPANRLNLAGGSIIDTAGNPALIRHSALVSTANNAVIVDNTAPTVLGAITLSSSGVSNNVLNLGDVVTASVRFSENMLLDSGANPSLTLQIGTAVNATSTAHFRQATFASITPSSGASGAGSIVNFVYTIGSSDLDSNGISIAANSISQAGGLKDLAGNPANVNHAALTDQSAFTVNGVPPSVSSVSLSSTAVADGYLSSGDVVTFDVQFNQAVSITGNPELTIRVGANDKVASFVAPANAAATTAAKFVYTIMAGDNDSNGISVVSMVTPSGVSILNSVANPLVLSTANASDNAGFKVDTTAPSITTISLSGEDQYGFMENEVVTATVTFSEAVSITGAPTLNLNIGGSTQTATYVSGNGASSTAKFVYTIGANDNDDDGISIAADSLMLAPVTIVDAAGNTAVISHSAVAGDVSSKVDTVEPSFGVITLSSSGVQNQMLGVGDVVTATVAFSEPVRFIAQPTLGLMVGTSLKDARLVGDFSVASSMMNFVYTIAAGDTDTDGISITAGALRGLDVPHATIFDTVGHLLNNSSPELEAQAGFKVDGSVPSITEINLEAGYISADNVMNVGDELSLVVTMSEVVNVTGEATLPFMLGESQKNASYVSGSGSSILVFTYTIAAGDTDSDGISLPAGAIAPVSAGQISDDAGNPAVLTFTALPAQNYLQVDTSAPSLLSVSLSSADSQNGWLNNGDVVTASVRYSENIRVSGTPTLALDVGGMAVNASYASGDGTSVLLFTYTIGATDSDSDGISISAGNITLAGGSIADYGNNAAPLALSAVAANSALKVDGAPPSVTAIALTGSGGQYDTLNQGDVVTLTVSFSEAVSISGNPTININAGGTQAATYAGLSNNSVANFVYTVAAGVDDSNGISVSAGNISLAGGNIVDVAGNQVNLAFTASLTDQASLKVDTTAPSVSAISLSASGGQNQRLNVGDVVTATASFNEAVIITGNPTISLEVGSVSREARFIGMSSGSLAQFVYTIAASDSDDDGIAISATQLALQGGVIVDFAGNSGSTMTPTLAAVTSLQVDNQAPSISAVSLSSAGGGGGVLWTGDVITASVTFDEAIAYAGNPSIVLNIGGASRVATVNRITADSVAEFVYTVGAGDNDSDGISLDANRLLVGITDLAGNAAVNTYSALSNQSSLKVDTTGPSVNTISFSATGGQNQFLNSNDVLTVSVSFNEAVTVTGNPTISLNIGGTSSNATYQSTSNDSVLNFVYTVQSSNSDSNGIAIAAGNISLAGGTIKDAIGNAATLSHLGLSDQAGFKVDNQGPTISAVNLTASGDQSGYLNAGDLLTLSATFSEAILYSGTPTATMVIGDSGASESVTLSNISNGSIANFIYTIQAGQTNTAANVLSGVNAIVGSFTDLAGNAAANLNYPVSGNSLSLGLYVDTTAPTAPSISLSSSVSGRALNVGDVVTASATYAEAIAVVGSPSLTLTLDRQATRVANFVSASGNVATFSYTIAAGDSDSNGISVAASALSTGITDLAGNVAAINNSALANVSTLKVDTSLTSVSAIQFSASNISNQRLNKNDVLTAHVTFSKSVSISGRPTLNLDIGGSSKTATFDSLTSDSVASFIYTIDAGDSDTDGVSIMAGNLAGGTINDNAGFAVNLAYGALPAQAGFRVDTTSPSLGSISVSASGGQNNLLNEGDIVTISATFNEAISASGSPTASLLINGSSRSAAFSSISSASVAQFTYTIAAGDSDANGVSIAANALSAGIIDLAGNSAVVVNAAGATQASLKVDTSAPAISAISLSGSGAQNNRFNQGDVVTATATFNEKVSITGNPSLSLDVGGVARNAIFLNMSNDSLAHFVYTIAPADSDSDGIAITATSFTLAGGSVQDLAGNNASLTSPTLSAQSLFVVDNTGPSISAVNLTVSGRQNNLLNAGDVVTASVTFNEAIAQTGNAGFLLNIGGVSRTANFSSISSDSIAHFVYTIAAVDRDSNGISVTADSLLAGITDLAGNAAATTHTAIADSTSLSIDNIAPSVSSIGFSSSGVANGYLSTDDILTATVTFSESVSFTGQPTISLDIGGVARTATYLNQSNDSVANFIYAIVSTDADDDGVAVSAGNISLAGGQIVDNAGNTASLSYAAVTAQSGFKVDSVAPTLNSISVSASGAQNSLLNAGDVVTVSATFNEAIATRASPTANIVLGSTTLAASFSQISNGSIANFVYTIQGEEVDSNGISIPNNALSSGFTDLAGNVAVVTLNGLSDDSALKVDAVVPSVSSISLSTSGAQSQLLNAGDVVTAIATFNESVTITGNPTITLDVGGVSRTATFLGLNSGSLASFVYTITTGDIDNDGIAITSTSMSLAGGAIVDAAGNNASLTTPTMAVNTATKVDTTAASVTNISLSASDGMNNLLNAGDVVTASVTFSEAISNAGNPTLNLNIGGISRVATFDTISPNNVAKFVYIIQAGDSDSNGISIDANSLSVGLTDWAGNAVVSTHSAVAAVTSTAVDTQIGSVASISLSSGSTVLNGTMNEGDLVTASVTFSESVNITGTPTLNLKVNNVSRPGTFSTLTSNSIASFIYTIQAGDTDADGISIDVGELSGAIQDLAGNEITLDNYAAVSASNLKVDTAAPSVTSVSLVGATGAQNRLLNVGDVVTAAATFSEAISVSGSNPSLSLQFGTTGNLVAKTAVFSGISNSSVANFVYTILASDSDTDGISINAGNISNASSISDAAGNTAAAGYSVIAVANTNYLVDTNAPTAASITLTADGLSSTGVLNMGDVITASVVYQESLASFGNPTLKLDIGGATRLATLGNINGSTATYYYTISTGDNDSNGVTVASNALSVGITDLAGNTGAVTTPGNNNIQIPPNFNVDTVAPSVMSINFSATGLNNGYLNVGDTVTAQVRFSENVVVNALPNLNISIGGMPVSEIQSTFVEVMGQSGFSSGILATFTYVIQSGQNDLDGISFNSFSGGTIKDLADNAWSPSFALFTDANFKVDTVAPTSTGTLSPDNQSSTTPTRALADLVFADNSGDTIKLNITTMNGSLSNISDFDANTPGIQLSGTGADLSAAFQDAVFQHTSVGAARITILLTDAAGNTTSIINNFDVVI